MNPRPARSVAEELLGLLHLENAPFRGLWATLLELGLVLAGYLALRWLLARSLRRLTRRLTEAAPGDAARLKTLLGMLRSLGAFALTFTAIVSAMALVGVNVAAILGTASVVGLAVGFGAQKLVKDVIAGFFLLLENQYVVGDYVTIGTVTGTVIELGMRITQIKDDEGRLYTLSNGDIATVCNHSRGPIAGGFEIALAATADITQARTTLEAALAAPSAALKLVRPATVEGVAAVEAARTVLRIGFEAPPGTRIAPLVLTLRDAAREALFAANIPPG